jgi:serine/threonine-protein kinase
MGPAPAKTRTTSPPARGVEASFSTSGGTAIARCTSDEAYLVSWSPRPGYGVKKVEQGPDQEVEVRFEGDDGRSELKVSCSNGSPVAETKDD